MPDPDVLVVGAGPTGLMTAAELERHGVRTRLVERDPAPHEQARATAIQARTLEIFERLGIVDGWLREGRPLGVSRIRSSDGEELHAEHLEELETPYPFTISIQQRKTERLLEQHLARLGGRVERGVELLTLAQDSHGIDVVLRTPGGEEAARFAYVVGTDGAHSRVRDALFVALEGGDYASVFAVAEVEAAYPYPDDETQLFVGPDGILLCAPFADGRLILIGNTPAGAGEQAPAREELQTIAGERAPAGIEIREVVWSAHAHIHCRLARHFRRGRVFLAGDAAHICSPFGGQGLNMGIHDAWNLGWKLGLVVDDRAPPRLLDSYESERRPIVKCELAYTDASHRALLSRDVAWPSTALAHEAAFVGSTDTASRRRLLAHAELDVTYRRSPIVASHGRTPRGAVHAGDWYPEPLQPGTHHLLAPAGAVVTPSAAARLPIQVHEHARDEVLLVRPDGYLGFASRPASVAPLNEYLEQVYA